MATIAELLDQGRLHRVPIDRDAAAAFLADAARHLENAVLVLGRGDTSGAYALAYDAARKAVTAHMRAAGYRLRNRPRAHQAVVDYATEALESPGTREALANLDRIRRTRHASEYEAGHIDPDVANTDVSHVRVLVEAVQASMS